MTKRLFESPLTPNEEYWAGFIHADGTISQNNTNMRFAQKDIEPVKEFLLFLGQESKISHTSRISNFGLNEMYSASTSKGVGGLRQLGIKTEVTPLLYKSKHFWRGMIDGDGHVSLPLVGETPIPRVMLCGDERDMFAFSRWCAELFRYQGPRPYRQKTGVWYVGLGAGKARLLGLYLYLGEYSAVTRKSKIAISFTEVTTRTNAKIVGQVA